MKLGDPERHQEGGPVKTEAKDAWGHQGLEETRKDPLLEASEGEWPCPHFDFGLLTCQVQENKFPF